MAVSNDNLSTLTGRVREARPGCGESQYKKWINDGIRETINKRSYWIDLRRPGIISVPNQFNSGTISVSPGSAIVAGSGTGFPVSDIVNTTLAEAVSAPGIQEIRLTNMAGITENSVLWIDAGTAYQEAVPVYRMGSDLMGPVSIYAKFALAHNSGVTVTQSSLVGQQLRTGYGHPVFTILAVQDAQTLLLDNPWGGLALIGVTYYIIRMYYTLFSDLRRIHLIVDQQTGIPLSTDRTQMELSILDPQRTDTSDPLAFASLGPNINNNMQYEIWPGPTSQRQLSFLVSRQWPELIGPDDIPPPFLEPTMFSDIATAKALRVRVSRDDPFHDPKLAQVYEAMFKEKLNDAISSDEDRAIQDYQQQITSLLPGYPGWNSKFSQQHAPEQISWEF